MRRLVATVGLAALVLLAGCQETSVDGPTLYLRNCAACHGGDLGGGTGPAIGAGTASAAQSDAELRSVIVNGAEGMPASDLDSEQIVALIAFVRERQAG